MLPDITTIIAAYVLFRVVETWGKKSAEYNGSGGFALAIIASILAGLVTVVAWYDIVVSASRSTDLLR